MKPFWFLLFSKLSDQRLKRPMILSQIHSSVNEKCYPPLNATILYDQNMLVNLYGHSPLQTSQV
jgi:hypothetical protein